MELPELRMTFADQAGLLRELQQNLRHGRAFLCQPTTIPVLSECTLVLVHPDHGEELRLPAQVVMVNPAGVGVSLASSYLAQLDRLEAFAAPAAPSAHETYVPPPSEAAPLEPELATVIPGEPLSDSPPEPIPPLTTWVPEAPSAPAAVLIQPLTAPPVSEDDRPTYIPGDAELAAAGVPTAPPPTAAPPAHLEIGEPAPELADEASFADVEEELAAQSGPPAQTHVTARGSSPDPLPPIAAGDADDLAEEELSADVMTPSGRPGRPLELQLENRQERLRSLNTAQQLKLARTGELADRIAVERLYGKQVWEALLHNPRLSIPEVARIARKGTVPKPLLEVILDNASWIKADAVRRALLSNPKIGPDAVLKLLRATPKHELKMIEKGTAYGAAVRESARKLLRQ